MRHIVFILYVCVFGWVGCSYSQVTTQPKETKFVSNDSTLLFTFVKDSLYVDTYESGCGIEAYRLKKVYGNENETLYEGYLTPNSIHSIRLSKDPMGSHWEYLIKFDGEEIIPINRME